MKRLDEEESNLEQSQDNHTIFSKISKRDVDGIKTNKIDMKELTKRIKNINHTHITDKASEYTRKHGLVSFGPKLNRLDALGNQIDR